MNEPGNALVLRVLGLEARLLRFADMPVGTPLLCLA